MLVVLMFCDYSMFTINHESWIFSPRYNVAYLIVSLRRSLRCSTLQPTTVGGQIAMPNLKPPVTTAAEALEYREVGLCPEKIFPALILHARS